MAWYEDDFEQFTAEKQQKRPGRGITLADHKTGQNTLLCCTGAIHPLRKLMDWQTDLDEENYRLESCMRENCMYSSEGR